jgi:hypothetical protein
MSSYLKTTRDYGIFELHPLNREEHEDPALAESMRKHGFMRSGAIHVKPNGSGKLKVIRGHHRLAEAKRQKLPVWYIVDDSNVDIFELEGSSHAHWSIRDFATARSRAGDKNYDVLLDFQKKHNLPMSVAASLVGGESAGSHNKQSDIKEGKFKTGDMIHANQVVRITDTLFEYGVECARTAGFVSAVSAAMRLPDFDAESFIARTRLYPKMMNRRSTRNEYLEEIEAMYNYGQRKRVPIAFLSRECMSGRAIGNLKK